LSGIRPMGLRDFWEWLLGWLILKEETRKARSALTEEIERLVEEVSPAIRNVRGYRQQLLAPVEKSKKYIEVLVAAIPGPIPLSAAAWGQGSPAELLFIDADKIRELFRKSVELESFFRQETTPQAVALLTATRSEKTIYAGELQGQIIRRDVPQTAVDFTDHRIVAPAATEVQDRRTVVDGALRLMGLRVLEHLTNLKSQKEDLAEERRLMGVKLKILQAHTQSLEGLLESHRESELKATKVRELLQEIDQELEVVTTVLGAPEAALTHLATFLSSPEYVLTCQPLTLRLNWMGVRVEEDAEDPGREISLAELEMPGRLKRVAVLVTVNREEVVRLT